MTRRPLVVAAVTVAILLMNHGFPPASVVYGNTPATGDLDATFGTGGAVVADFGGDDYGWQVAIQPDGKIVVIVQQDVGSGSANFTLARFNGDGTLDSTFGSGGRVDTDFAGGDDFSYGVALQTDGRIVVAWRLQAPATN